MFKNKLLNISIIIIISIILLGILAFVLYQYIFPGSTDNNQDKVIEYEEAVVTIPKISTNLGDSSIISIQMTITVQTKDQEDAISESEEKMYKIKDEINLFVKNYSIDSFSTEASINMFKKIYHLELMKY